jgi:transposase-like protein
MKNKANPEEHFCPNKECPNYGKKGPGNNIIRKGYNRKGKQVLNCKICGNNFAMTNNTFFYHKHLSEEEIILICKLLVEKNNISAIARITGRHRDTVSDLISDMATHCREVTDFLIKGAGLDEGEVDEMWSFIKKKKRRLVFAQ